MRKILLLLSILLVNFTLFAQKVVVSEYNNVTGDPLGEWTELLVVDDNVDLVGYTLRDNAGSTPPPSQWTGGIRFKNHPLWKNLRAGTIIVINHRYASYQSVDVDKRDGYIEIDAENETYFEKRCFSCILGPEWYQKALNIAQESDIVQLIDQNDNHVHALAHLPEAKGDWVNLPPPKIAFVGSIPRGGVTVRVCPGRTISAYNNGFDTREQEVTQSADYVTKGKPNNRSLSIDVNQLFWRSLREPVWNTPNAVARLFADSVVLSWNAILDPNPSDCVSGYLIVRIPYENLGNAFPPIDGKIYREGDFIGSAKVVGVVNYSQTTRFVDRFQVPCGSKYVYRIYSFRFREDDFHEDTREVFARGRSYNESNFAEVVVEKTLPPKPIIDKMPSDKDTLCKGDLLILYVSNFTNKSFYKFEWLKDGNVIYSGNNDTLMLSEGSGEYILRLIDSLGCLAMADPVRVTFLDYPQLEIFLNGSKITKDTLVVACPNQSLELEATGWFNYSLFKDGRKVSFGTQSTWKLDSSGIFWVSAENYSSKGSCIALSPKVKVKLLSLDLEFSSNSIVFKVGKNEVYRDTIIRIRNLSDTILQINNVSFSNSAFSLVFPPSPIRLEPGEKKDITIRFKPEKSGKLSGYLLLEKDCNIQDTIFLSGEKEKSVFILITDEISFGIIPSCYDFLIDTSFVINVDFDESVEIQNIFVQFPFEVLSPNFPIRLKPNDKLCFKVKLNVQNDGYFTSNLIIVYSYSGLLDTLKIPITATIEDVSYKLTRNFPPIVYFDECENNKTLSVNVRNTSKLKLSLDVSSNKTISLTNGSFEINPEDSLSVKFDVKPLRIGLDTALLIFKFTPCDIHDTMLIVFNKKGIIVNFSADTIDFGQISVCNSKINETRLLTVKIKGDSINLTKISEVKIDYPFDIIFPNDSLLNDGNNITINFKPYESGNFTSEIILRLAPCGNEYKLVAKGNSYIGRFFTYPDTLDFGEIEVGRTSEMYFYVKNNGKQNIELDTIFIENSKAFMVTNTQPYTNLIQSNDSVYVFVTFKPLYSGEFVSYVDCKIGFPCDTSIKIVIKGTAINPNPGNFILALENYHFRPSTSVHLPIKFEISSASLVDIDSIDFSIQYNPSVLGIQNIFGINFLTKVEMQHKEGLLKITAIPSDKNLFKGEVAEIEGKIFLGDERISFLRFVDAKIFGKRQMYLDTINGSITLDSLCEADLRLISQKTLPQLNVGFEDSELIIKINSSERFNNLEIFIYNILGQCVDKMKIKDIEPSERFVFVPIEIPYGIYIVFVKIGGVYKEYYLIK